MGLVRRVLLGMWIAAAACNRTEAHAPDLGSQPKPAAADGLATLDLEHRSFPLLVWSAFMVEHDYFDPGRFDPRGQLSSALQSLGAATPEFFSRIDARTGEIHVDVRASSQAFSLADVTTLRVAADRLESILEFTQSVLQLPADELHALEYAAINGFVAPLDPNTVLLDPESNADLGVRTRGAFGGIGAEIRAEDRRIRIVRVLPDGPAARAGLQDGDLLLRIDGQSTKGLGSLEAQKRLRGQVGDVVALQVARGGKTLLFSVARAIIKIPALQAETLPGNVGFIRISSFQEDTSEAFEVALEKFARDEVAGLILDLRGNSGGLLTQATRVLDALIDAGDLVIVRSSFGREAEAATAGQILPSSVLITVLLDEQSASASEIVGGGLQALGRGLVVGRPSFGKGSVQMLKQATPYGREVALKLTVAEYLVAGDRAIQSIGVVPDLALYPVELSATPGVAYYYDVERFERARERSIGADLPSAKHVKPLPKHQPPPTIRYFVEAPEDRVEAEALRDPELRIAHELVTAFVAEGADGAKERIAASRVLAAKVRAFADARDAAEQQRIVAALRELAVDWSDGDDMSSEDLAVAASVRPGGPIVTGAAFQLHVEVENRGERVANRVHLISNCMHEELDGIELLIGAVAPGKKVSRQIELRAMPWRGSFTDDLWLDVHAGEPGPTPDARARVRLVMQETPRPRFAYSTWIVDDVTLVEPWLGRKHSKDFLGDEFTVTGNGDGMLQAGERVLLAIDVRNEGDGGSRETRAVVRNKSPTQALLEDAAIELGEVAAGGRVSDALALTIDPQADPATGFSLQLAVGDAALRESVQHDFDFRVLESTPESHLSPALIVLEADARVYAGAHASAGVLGHIAAGSKIVSDKTFGGFWRVRLGPGRVGFVPADLPHHVVDRGPGASRLAASASNDAVEIVLQVRPPRLEIVSPPRVVAGPQVQLHGVATHPERVRDVTVTVAPANARHIEHKQHYLANRATDGEGQRRLEFTTKVALVPGSNRISILARDSRGVEQRQELWVLRDDAWVAD